MGQFVEVTKHLSITPARKATAAEAAAAPLPFDKYYTLEKARKIDRINITFNLPSFMVEDIGYYGRLLFQYNFTAPRSFYILNEIKEDTKLIGLLCVKWRVGTEVFRYALRGYQYEHGDLSSRQLFDIPWYANQVVPENCVFELWSSKSPVTMGTCGLLQDYVVKTSLLSMPDSPSTTKVETVAETLLDVTGMGFALPFVAPVDNSSNIYLTN